MNSIDRAKAALNEAKEYRAVEVAQVYATIAQAEQTKRVADALERWLSVQGVLPEFYEMVDRVRAEMPAPDAQDFDSEDDYNYALEDYKFRRQQTGWGKDTDEEAEARTDYADPLN